jgi:lipocalin
MREVVHQVYGTWTTDNLYILYKICERLSLQFLGVWYEVLRVPTLMEVGASCVKNNYTQTADGKIHVENELKPL